MFVPYVSKLKSINQVGTFEYKSIKKIVIHFLTQSIKFKLKVHINGLFAIYSSSLVYIIYTIKTDFTQFNTNIFRSFL